MSKSDHCRGCLSRELVTLYDFGPQPLAGHFPLKPESQQPASRYPLDLTECARCGLLQVVNLPPIGEVFHDDYRYSSSTVPGLVRHFAGYATWLQARVGPQGRIFEFGCNDGVLLEKLRELGIACAGIDASDNVARLARAKGLDVTTGFLTEEFAREPRHAHQYDLVTCSNVFAHIHDLQTTLRAVRALLRPEGLFAIEVHDAEHLLAENQFDTIYHEHLTYFTEHTLRALLERSGFAFVSCERTPMHGGALRLLGKRTELGRQEWPATPRVTVSREHVIGPAIERCRADLVRLHQAHGPLVGYGAAGRSQMFINFTRSAELFRAIYDDSPFRQGRYIVGTDIPILAPRAEPVPCVVVLAWNYAEDIARKLRGSVGQIVTLLPQLRTW